jgi:hypothetical protein
MRAGEVVIEQAPLHSDVLHCTTLLFPLDDSRERLLVRVSTRGEFVYGVLRAVPQQAN